MILAITNGGLKEVPLFVIAVPIAVFAFIMGFIFMIEYWIQRKKEIAA